jgi:hypothetical protein
MLDGADDPVPDCIALHPSKHKRIYQRAEDPVHQVVFCRACKTGIMLHRKLFDPSTQERDHIGHESVHAVKERHLFRKIGMHYLQRAANVYDVVLEEPLPERICNAG